MVKGGIAEMDKPAIRPDVSAQAAYDVAAIRRDFPILSREVYGKPLVYLDNAASAQKPQQVIDTISHAYANEYANVHRGLHYLSNTATENYEAAREKDARVPECAIGRRHHLHPLGHRSHQSCGPVHGGARKRVRDRRGR
jgi:hypothetical protein